MSAAALSPIGLFCLFGASRALRLLVSQAAVEQVLGRLLTDAAFRERFFTQAAPELLRHFALSGEETDALLKSRRALVKELLARQGACLDPGICRADLRVLEGAAHG